jgi:hypothetical protein
MSHSQITTGGPKPIGPLGQSIQTYNNQPSGGWALAESAEGWKGGFFFVAVKFRQKFEFEGGVSYS